MDAQDFIMPSPKRQRTESPKPALETKPEETVQSQAVPAETATSEQLEMKPVDNAAETFSTIPGLGIPDKEPGSRPVEAQAPVPPSNGFLDVLMQHVESMSQPQPGETVSENILEAAEPPSTHDSHAAEINGEPAIKSMDTQPDQYIASPSSVPAALKQQPTEEGELIQQDNDAATIAEPARQEKDVLSGAQLEQDQIMTEVKPETGANITASGMAASQDQTMSEAQNPEPKPTTAEGAEWEVDSSPYVSSDSDDSSDTTSDDSDDVDGDYAMLDPEEQARILMAGDGGSDDEGDKKGKTDGGHLRTANEKVEEVIPKPDIVVTEQMKIEELGTVEGIVEKTVLVRAKVSGEYQVLESNSLLCLEDRSVVGVVAEPLGRVEQPMYTIRFTNDEAIKEAGLSERGEKVFYVPQHSTFVFTQPLKAVKGSDASNFHDEEVGDDEMEFSDDEQEAEHKRQMKLKRQGRRDEQGGGRGRGRGGRGNHQRGGRQEFRAPSSDGGSIYGNAVSEISYDDAPDGNDEDYTPLARPANLSDLMAGVQREPMEGSHHTGGYSDRGNLDTGRGRGRGRRGNPNFRGSRGAWAGRCNQPSWTTYQNPSGNRSNGCAQQPPQPMLPPAQFPYPYQQQQPHQPRLSPQTQAFSPSPISPLAANQFNFNFQQQSQQWPGAQPHQQQFGQMPQGNPQYGAQQFAPGQQPGQPSTTNGWNPNQAGAAFVAAQLEQLRRNQQGQ
jgi:H/ACA ribonucleoprotein complex non-core subunit NAF1